MPSPVGGEAHRIVRRALEDESAGDLLVTAPRFGFTEAIREAQSAAAAELLDRGRAMRAVYNERLDAGSFMALLDGTHAIAFQPALRGEKTIDAMLVVGTRRGRDPGARAVDREPAVRTSSSRRWATDRRTTASPRAFSSIRPSPLGST